MAVISKVNGLTFASVKTWLGLAMASVKTINGMDAASSSYLVAENFEGTGYEASGTEVGTGTLDEDYATSPAPLVGSQSLRIANSVQPGRVYWSFTAQADVWAYFQVNWVTLPATGKQFAGFSSGADTPQLSIEFQAGGVIRVRGGSQNATTVDGMTTGVTYHVWIHYTKGSGSNAFVDIGFSTDGTKPTSGNKYASKSNGTTTLDADRFYFGSSGNGTWEAVFDKLRVSSSAIGDNPT